jgi:hypothetical protein
MYVLLWRLVRCRSRSSLFTSCPNRSGRSACRSKSETTPSSASSFPLLIACLESYLV